MYVFEICAEGIFVTFPWWLENVKSRPKIALFSNERHFEIWFPKKRTITFFWGKLSKLHKNPPPPILHVATIFSLKQGETRTSHGPIPHPLKHVRKLMKALILSSNRWLWQPFCFYPNQRVKTETFFKNQKYSIPKLSWKSFFFFVFCFFNLNVIRLTANWCL